MIIIDTKQFFDNVTPWIKFHNMERHFSSYSTELHDGNAIDDQILAEILGLTEAQ